ncbi:Hypothetical protein NTJ_08175 [Nesidiocoris tenuis]|uniref:Uncharacterized protein n=1 Tax=Nesidiocoris tenuis TaxID=355587 RepID=A0ABN7AT50_9HEMI|nr:Hypothetical protein NTJ_08175 [Nesidiocoris tenuis]
MRSSLVAGWPLSPLPILCQRLSAFDFSEFPLCHLRLLSSCYNFQRRLPWLGAIRLGDPADHQLHNRCHCLYEREAVCCYDNADAKLHHPVAFNGESASAKKMKGSQTLLVVPT